MSTNAPQVQQPQDDPWIPKRVHGGLRHVRRVGRGNNRHYEFQGQEPGEIVKLPPIRKHKIFLIPPALPLLFTILALIGVFVLDLNFSFASPFWAFLALLFGILFLITGAYFVYKDFLLWWIETVIITNKRIIIWKHLLTPTRQQVPLERVVQVGVDQRSPWSLLFAYGDVHLYLVGGRVDLHEVPNPKKVRDNFERIKEEAKQNKKPPEPHPEPENPDLRQVLAKLAQKDPLPTLPNPDEKYAHRQRPGGKRGPLRRFAGPLRLESDVHYISADEQTVMYIQRSKYVLALKLILPILVLLAVIIATLYIPSILPFASIGILLILVWIVLTIVNYFDDVFILTTRRIIDIERRLVILDEEHKITEYGQIKAIRMEVGNPIFLLLDVGDVYVETPGNNPDIELTHIDHPFAIQDILIALKGHKEKVEKIEGANKRKEELNQWFGTVLDTMEKTVLGRGVPNLQTLDLFEAAQRARQFGMKVVPVGEDASYPNIESGLIVAQNPLPGTLMQVDSNNPEERPQIQVILSKRS